MLRVPSKQEVLGGLAHSRCNQLWRHCEQGPLSFGWSPTTQGQCGTCPNRLDFASSPGRRRGRGRARMPQGRSGVSSNLYGSTPNPSLRWAMGFSLQEGNGFWPETTAPLSHFRLASPLHIRSSSYTWTWGLVRSGGRFRPPSPRGSAVQTSSHPSVLP